MPGAVSALDRAKTMASAKRRLGLSVAAVLLLLTACETALGSRIRSLQSTTAEALEIHQNTLNKVQ